MTKRTSPPGKSSRRKPSNSSALRATKERLSFSGSTLRDEANAIVAMAFRNGPIEELHAGKSSELLTDPTLSRMNDAEMKVVMIHACRKVAELLRMKEAEPERYCQEMMAYNDLYCRGWER